MKLSHAIFCIGSLTCMWMIAKLAFPYAAKPASEIEFSSTPQSAELFDDIDLGEFGIVPVLDLVDYYIENPPASESSANTETKTRFQGC